MDIVVIKENRFGPVQLREQTKTCTPQQVLNIKRQATVER